MIAVPQPLHRKPTSPHNGRANLTASMTEQEAALVARLLDQGLSDSQVLVVKQHHRENLGRGSSFARLLVEFGLATEAEVALWLAEHYKSRVVTTEELRPAPDALSLLNESVARARCALPLQRKNGSVVVAIGDPELPQFQQVRHALAAFTVEFVFAPFSDILAAVEENYAVAVTVSTDNELEQLVEQMYRDATATRGVSDIHLIPGERSVAIKFRHDGDLQQWRVIEGSLRERLAAQVKLSSKRGKDGRTRLSTVGGLDVSQRAKPQGASAMREYGSRQFSLRFSVIPSVNGESIVIRVLDQNAQVGDLTTLGMLEDHAALYRRSVKLPWGLILNVGPTGHGKSTTLAAAVQYIDVHRKRVLTIEDPVEYRLRNVTQCEAQPEAGFGFPEALKEFMRHNPNVIILGEMRDTQTAKAGLSLSLTGHLLLSTTHANTALGGLVRMLELDADASMLAASAKLMLSQRLVPRLCPQCRRPHERGWSWLKRYSNLFNMANKQGLIAKPQLFEVGGGCEKCKGRGFLGRIAIYEMRLMRPVVASGLATQKREFDPILAEKFYAEGFHEGKLDCRTLEQDGMLKAALGILSPEEVLAATVAEV